MSKVNDAGKNKTDRVSDTRYGGTVKWFSAEKGYGFIEPADPKTPGVGDKDLFVHSSGLAIVKIDEGDKVTYVVGKRAGRFCAVEVQLA